MSRRSNNIRPRRRQRRRRLRQQRDTRIILNLIVIAIPRHHAAVPMRRVLAQTNIRNHHQRIQRTILLERPQRRLHNPIVSPRTTRLLILLRRQTKQQQPANPQRSASLSLLHRLIDRQIEDPRHRADLFANTLAGTDKQRIDQRSRMQMRLANQRPHRLRPAQPAQTRNRKVHTQF